MDLVEIRKKAKDKKQKLLAEKPAADEAPAKKAAAASEKPALKEPEPVAETPTVPGPEPEPDEPVSVSESEPLPESADEPDAVADQDADNVDPLDELFRFHQESALTTVDNYLQTLSSEEATVDSNTEQWLTFTLGNEEYALSIESVSEIIKPREVTDIPRVPNFISGIISLRGIIVPVFDLNRRLSLGSGEVTTASRIIVCQEGERLAGFMVDRINQVVNVPLKNIEPPPTVLSGLDRDFVEGVGRVDNKMLILLHLANVIDAELG